MVVTNLGGTVNNTGLSSLRVRTTTWNLVVNLGVFLYKEGRRAFHKPSHLPTLKYKALELGGVALVY